MVIESPWPSLAPYPKAHLADWLEDASLRWGEKAAFIDREGRSYSFRQTFDLARRIGRFLQEEGVAKGDRVAVVSFNSVSLVIHYLGVIWSGGVLVPLNPLYRARELKQILANSGARVALVAGVGPEGHPTKSAISRGPQARVGRAEEDALAKVEGMKGELPELSAVYPLEGVEGRAAQVPPEPLAQEIDPEADPAVMYYTGGTTGLPKGVPLTHFEIVASLRQLNRVRDHKATDTFLDFSHLHLAFAATSLAFSGLFSGSTQVVMPRFDPEEAATLIEKHRVTYIALAPPALTALAEAAEQGRYDPSSLALIISGGAVLPEEVLERARRALGCAIIDSYGLSETSATNCHSLLRIKTGSMGAPVPDTVEKVVSLDTGQEVGRGEVGELFIRGPQVFKGYWRNPEATAEALTPDGWFRTGDLVWADEEGYVYVIGRIKEIIKYKGYQVTPAELEGVLMEHPAVQEAAVIPKADREAGEVPKAVVVLRPGTQASPEELKKELMAFVEARVVPYKKVREVEFIDAIPRSPLGKILRRELIDRERAAGGAAGP